MQSQKRIKVSFYLLLILLALITESFSTAWYSGAIHGKLVEKMPARLPLALALSKGIILPLGMFLGRVCSSFLPSFYITMAYSLMFIIGLKMITENLRFHPEERIVLIDNNRTLLILSLAGSFNTFFIGISLGLISTKIALASVITFMATLILAYAAMHFGKKFGLRPFIRITGMVMGAVIVLIAMTYFIKYFIA